MRDFKVQEDIQWHQEAAPTASEPHCYFCPPGWTQYYTGLHNNDKWTNVQCGPAEWNKVPADQVAVNLYLVSVTYLIGGKI